MTISAQPSGTSAVQLIAPPLNNPRSSEQPSQSSRKLQQHPLLGLWNPIYQGWLVSDVKEVHADSSIWTDKFNEAQTFRTEQAAANAKKHLRDFYNISTSVCVLNFADA